MLKHLPKYNQPMVDKNYQMIPNPNNNTSNFINSCEDYTEKVTLIEKDKIINVKDSTI